MTMDCLFEGATSGKSAVEKEQIVAPVLPPEDGVPDDLSADKAIQDAVPSETQVAENPGRSRHCIRVTERILGAGESDKREFEGTR